MRSLELMLTIICMLLLVHLFSYKLTKLTGAVVSAASGVALFMQLIIEGYRWQMLFVYCVTVISINVVMLRRRNTPTRDKTKSPLAYICYLLMGGLIVISIGLSVYLPVFNLPTPTGTDKVGTQIFYFKDESRDETFTDDPADKRELMVQIWYPAGQTKGSKESPLFPEDKKVFKKFIAAYAEPLNLPPFVLDYWKYMKSNSYEDAEVKASETPYPVIILNHGMGTGRLLHASQAENLASHGYVVVAIDHTYNTAATVFPDGHVTSFNTDEKMDMDRNTSSNLLLEVWTQDVEFVLKQMKELNSGGIQSRFNGKLDMGNIGVMGHSFGGATAFNAYDSISELKAGVDLDGSLFNLDSKYEITKPFMFIQSEDFIKIQENSSKEISDQELTKMNLTREELIKLIDNMHKENDIINQVIQHGGTLIDIKGTAHYNFTDFQLYSSLLNLMGMTGEIEGSRGAYIVNQYVLDFFDKHLKGTGGQLLEGPSPDFPEVEFPQIR